MKKILLILLLLFLSFESLSCLNNKDVIGIWQWFDSKVSAGYKARYEFNEDGSFKYYTSDYADNNPLRSISGIYKLYKDSILLTIREFAYKKGYIRIGDSDQEDTAEWVIEHDTVNIVKCDSHCIQKAHVYFNFSKKKKKIKSIDINGFIFYKLNE